VLILAPASADLPRQLNMHFNQAKRLLRNHGFEVERYDCSIGGWSASLGEYIVTDPETFRSYKLFTEGVKRAGDRLMELTGGVPPENCPKAPPKSKFVDLC